MEKITRLSVMALFVAQLYGVMLLNMQMCSTMENQAVPVRSDLQIRTQRNDR